MMERKKIAAVFLVVAALTGTAAGQTPADEIGNCVSEAIDLDVKIAACTAIINAGRETSEHLAVAFDDRGAAYYRKGEYDRALGDFEQAIRLDAKNAFAYNNRGNVYQRNGQYDRAIADYDQAIRLKPDYADAFYGRGRARQKNGDVAGGDGDLAQAKRLDLEQGR